MSYAFGADTAFDAFCYGSNHPSTVQWMQDRLTTMNQTVMGAGKVFIEKAQSAFDHYNGTAAIQFVREVLQSVKGATASPRIQTLWELEQIQQADLIMQRWVMANPTIRTLYHQQQCDGYSDTYIDANPGEIGEAHYDYRRVMNGIMRFDESGDWEVKQYMEELHEGDRELIFDEQCDILLTWNSMDLILALGKDDPTSNTGGLL